MTVHSMPCPKGSASGLSRLQGPLYAGDGLSDAPARGCASQVSVHAELSRLRFWEARKFQPLEVTVVHTSPKHQSVPSVQRYLEAQWVELRPSQKISPCYSPWTCEQDLPHLE